MAYEVKSPSYPNFIASADYSSTGQYRLVKLSTTVNQVTLTTTGTDSVFGVLQNNPSSGQSATLWAMGSAYISKVYHDGTATLGGFVTPSTTAGLVTATTSNTSHRYGPVAQAESTDSGTVIAMVLAQVVNTSS